MKPANIYVYGTDKCVEKKAKKRKLQKTWFCFIEFGVVPDEKKKAYKHGWDKTYFDFNI